MERVMRLANAEELPAVDWAAVPEYVKRDLAATAYQAIVEFMKRPDARELLDSVDERLRCDGSTLLQPKKK